MSEKWRRIQDALRPAPLEEVPNPSQKRAPHTAAALSHQWAAMSGASPEERRLTERVAAEAQPRGC